MTKPCQCPKPGWCPRWKREMLGRLWEVCSERYSSNRSPPLPGVRDQMLAEWRRAARWYAVQAVLRFGVAVLRFLINWCQTVPQRVYEERLRICTTLRQGNPCAHWTPREDRSPHCSRCGCRGLKWRWASEKCPLSPPHWDTYQPTSWVWWAIAKVLVSRCVTRVMEFANGGPLPEPLPRVRRRCRKRRLVKSAPAKSELQGEAAVSS